MNKQARYKFLIDNVEYEILFTHIRTVEYERRHVIYRLRSGGKTIFEGDDFSHTHRDPVGLEALDDLNVLLLRYPGDGSGAGEEIFSEYTEDQMRFAVYEAERLQNTISDWLEEQGVKQ